MLDKRKNGRLLRKLNSESDDLNLLRLNTKHRHY